MNHLYGPQLHFGFARDTVYYLSPLPDYMATLRNLAACLFFGLTATPTLAIPPCWYYPAEGCVGRAVYDDEADRTFWYESCDSYFVHGSFSGNHTSLICGF